MPKQRPQAFYEELVDTMQSIYGAHKGYRAAHAKGTYVKGHFQPSPAATRLSRAPHFAQKVPVTARFSNGSGLPTARDHDPDARGVAVKFHLPDGSITDIVTITLPAFFVRTPEDFHEFLKARKDPAKMPAFLEKHPETARVLKSLESQPKIDNYFQVAYNGIHTFRLTNAENVTVNARSRLEPVARPWKTPPGTPGVNGFQDELRARLKSGPVEYDFYYVVAKPGDALDDPTVAWPADRDYVQVGRITLDTVDERPSDHTDTAIFDPNNVTDGIATSDDEILHARGPAYSVSYTRRMAK